ncbi:hypothetical protein ACFWIZ_28315, partial [Streptomyces sp. NPDC127044]
MFRQGPMIRPLLRVPLERWKEQDALLKDGFLALALTLLAFVPTLSTIGAQIGDLPERPTNALGMGLVLAQTLPLAARRRWPPGGVGGGGGGGGPPPGGGGGGRPPPPAGGE